MQAQTLLLASRDSRLHTYVVLSVMTGLRTEELRAPRWSDVDLEAGAVAVYRSVRVTGIVSHAGVALVRARASGGRAESSGGRVWRRGGLGTLPCAGQGLVDH